MRFNMVPTPGIEPGSTVLQTAAMTTFAKLAIMVLLTRIELVIHPYQGCVIPLNYKSFGTPRETRTLTPKHWLLRPACLPIPPPGQN